MMRKYATGGGVATLQKRPGRLLSQAKRSNPRFFARKAAKGGLLRRKRSSQ